MSIKNYREKAKNILSQDHLTEIDINHYKEIEKKFLAQFPNWEVEQEQEYRKLFK